MISFVIRRKILTKNLYLSRPPLLRSYSTPHASRLRQLYQPIISYGSKVRNSYMYFLVTYPLPVKMVTSGAIAAIGDGICQFGENRKSFDWKRFGIFTFVGVVYIAPQLHYWYGLLEWIVPTSSRGAVIKRLVIDQFAFAPMAIAAFLSLILVLEKGSVNEVQQKLDHDWWPTLQDNWKVWIPFQAINFGLVPLHLRVLFANAVGCLWNAYMSNVCHKDEPMMKECPIPLHPAPIVPITTLALSSAPESSTTPKH